MKLGVIGLPNVGKSTLFNAITNAGAAAANYPFCTIDKNTGVVGVPDRRVDALAALYHPRKTTTATIEFVDIAGLVRGASRGEGLGNRFLSHIREVDAVVHVVRCFEDGNIAHVEGGIDPERDMGIVNLELILADLETVERRRDKAVKLLKTSERRYALEAETAERLLAHLGQERPARNFPLEGEAREIVRGWFLLTDKPVIYAANIAEGDLGQSPEDLPWVRAVSDRAREEGAGTLVISAEIEQQIAALEPGEREQFLKDLGIGESGLDRLVQACYRLLGLISFLTVGEDECRAWTIRRGTRAQQAAGRIHSDMERGFIRAEIVPFDTLMRLGSMAQCREKGLVRSEGRDYVMQDGDVTLFRFNV